MQLSAETINTELKFEKNELMKLFMCLAILQTSKNEEDMESHFRIYQKAIFYLGSKIGAELDKEELEIVKSFSNQINNLNKEKESV